MEKKKNGFLKSWILNTLLGWTVGFVLVVLPALLIESIGLGHMQFFVGAGMGLGVGYFQARVLKKQFGWSNHWLWITCVGLTVSFILFDFGNSFIWEMPEYNLVLGVSFAAIVLAIWQTIYLQRKSGVKSWSFALYALLAWGSAVGMVRITDFFREWGINGWISLVYFATLAIVLSSVSLGFFTGTGIRRYVRVS